MGGWNFIKIPRDLKSTVGTSHGAITGALHISHWPYKRTVQRGGSGAFPVMAIPENDVTKDVPQLICNRLLRFKSQIPGKVSKIVQISTPEG
jgi:hypothetical protein